MAFFAHDFRDFLRPGGPHRAAASRRSRPAAGLAVLRAQQDRLPPSAARRANVDMLAGGGTAVVATGQQVGLFLGPLYSFYKAASAVAVARALSAEAGVPCVPCSGCRRRTTTSPRSRPPPSLIGVAWPPAWRWRPSPRRRRACRLRIVTWVPTWTRLVDRLAEALPPGVAADQAPCAAARTLRRPGDPGRGLRRSDGDPVRRRGPAVVRSAGGGCRWPWRRRSTARRCAAPPRSSGRCGRAARPDGGRLRRTDRAACTAVPLLFFHRGAAAVRGTGCREAVWKPAAMRAATGRWRGPTRPSRSRPAGGGDRRRSVAVVDVRAVAPHRPGQPVADRRLRRWAR